MKYNLSPKVVSFRGITLMELTVVIVVLITLISVLSIGARAWRRASDRSACVMTIRNLQVATRSYQNLYGYYFGGQPRSEYGTQEISRHLFEKGFISQDVYNQSKGSRVCSGGGIYKIPAPNAFPMPGDLYMQCPLATTQNHKPDPGTSVNW
jgi:type II secretory pathway pseudopilin PulG